MKRIVLMLWLISYLASCNTEKAKPEEKEEKHPEAAAGNIVSLTEDQIRTANIELGHIEQKNLKTSIRANGMLTVPNQNKAFVTALYGGVVRTLLIQPGNYVKKGQVIASIVNPDIVQLQQELITANAEINMAEIEERRQKELIEGNAAPLKNLQQVETRLRTLRGQRAGLQKQLGTLGISSARVGSGNITASIAVTAPISGTVSTVQAQIGSNVDQSTPMAEIVNNSQLHLDLFVYEKDLPRLHENQTIHFTLTNNPGKEYDARIYSIGTAFASESKTIPIHAIVNGDKTGLIEGMNITALVSIGTNVAPAVPTDAIVNYQGQDYIFVQTNEAVAKEHHKEEGEPTVENKKNEHVTKGIVNFERIQVIKGTSDVGYTEITPVKPVSPNVPIIIKGTFFVLAKMTNTGGDEH